MQTKTCPDCGDDIPYRAKLHSCGWRESAAIGNAAKAHPPQPDRYRCAWVTNGDRCRYVGSSSLGKGTEERFCLGHLNCADATVGAHLVARSMQEIAAGMDYSGQAIAAAAARLPPVPRSAAELQAAREYPKPKGGGEDGVGRFWACRIVREFQLGQPTEILPLANALKVLGLGDPSGLAKTYPPTEGA
jgi:hypothetical protein